MFNIIFIVVDTLRKDFADNKKDEFKKIGFHKFNNLIAPSNWTTPSHASIFTGLYLNKHKVHNTKFIKNEKVKITSNLSSILLSNILRNIGYNTFLISANMFINPLFGFKGFDLFYDTSTMPLLSLFSEEELVFKEKIRETLKDSSYLKKIYKYIENKRIKLLLKTLFVNLYSPLYKKIARRNWPYDKGLKKSLKILNKFINNKTVNNFIFINLMDVHEPYFDDDYLCNKGLVENLKNGFLDPILISNWKNQYGKQVDYVFDNLIDFFRKHKDDEYLKKSMIIITSDHGQMLGEYNRVGHVSFLYDELINVPLYIKFPEHIEVNLVEKNKIMSLVNFKRFILNSLKQNKIDMKFLSDECVFSESYGININIPEVKNEVEKKNIEKIDKYKCAIYFDTYKGIYNVEDKYFESIINIKDKTNIVDKNVEAVLLDKINSFLDI